MDSSKKAALLKEIGEFLELLTEHEVQAQQDQKQIAENLAQIKALESQKRSLQTEIQVMEAVIEAEQTLVQEVLEEFVQWHAQGSENRKA